MDLPKTGHIGRVEYHYDNGDVYYIEGQMADDYNSNVEAASIMHVIHGGGFKPIQWQKEEEKEAGP